MAINLSYILAKFETYMDEEKKCDLHLFLRYIMKDEGLQITCPNTDTIRQELKKLLQPKFLNIRVTFKEFLLILDSTTSLKRERLNENKLSWTDRFKNQVYMIEVEARKKYAQLLDSHRIEHSIPTSASIEEFNSAEAFRQAQKTLDQLPKLTRFTSVRSVEQVLQEYKLSSIEVEEEDVAMEVSDRIQELVDARMQLLDPEQLHQVEVLLNGPRSDEVVIDKFNVQMRRRDITTLRDGCWLNDEVINFYMQLLKQRDALLCEADPSRLPNRFMNSFFVHKLIDAESKYVYSNVRRWTKSFDVFQSDKIFFPVNLSNTHWTLAVIHMKERYIAYYDSMAGSGSKYLKALLQWVQDEHKDKKGSDLDVSEWKLVPCEAEATPQQLNGVDCGVFTTMFADFISDALPLMSFQQMHIPLFRRKIAHFILNGEIDYPA